MEEYRAERPFVSIWQGMKQRCHNSSSPKYYRYGARGISVHPPWLDDYPAFETWILENLGPRPEGTSLDRIDNDGNYEPGNLQWASAKDQAYNRNAQGKSVEIIEILRAQIRELGAEPRA